MILEPVVQGAGGMRFHSPACVALMRELCDEHGLLLVLDEIATGFGRTGAMFACEHAACRPDVMCVGKALTGGYMTLAATLCTPERRRGGLRGRGRRADARPDVHGQPAGLLGRAGLAGAARGRRAGGGGWRRSRRACAPGSQPARELPGVADVRVLGAIGVIELERARRHRRRHRRRGRSAACGCARSAGCLRDAALRDRRRGPRAGRGGDAGSGVCVRSGRLNAPRALREQRPWATQFQPNSKRRQKSGVRSRRLSRPASAPTEAPPPRAPARRARRSRPAPASPPRPPPSRAIVSRLERSSAPGCSGHGVSTTAAHRAGPPRGRRSASSSVWLIVPSPGRAAMSSGRPQRGGEVAHACSPRRAAPAGRRRPRTINGAGRRRSRARRASSAGGVDRAPPPCAAARWGETAGPKRSGATSSGVIPAAAPSSSWSAGHASPAPRAAARRARSRPA